MSGQFPSLDRQQVESILKKLGFTPKPQGGTSHVHWEGFTKGQRRVVTVDNAIGKKEKFSKDLTGKMIEQSGLKKKDFYKYL